jgi:hypothetical protein
LLSVQETSQADLVRYQAEPDKVYREYEDREFRRDKHWQDDFARVTATAQHPDMVRWEDIPPRVRVTFMRESGGVKPDQILRYREHDNIIFQTNIPTGGGRVHMLQVLPNGDIYNEGDFNEHGKVENRDWRPHTVSYGDVPRRVREVVDREGGRGRIIHVDEARRPGGDIYTVEVDEPGDTTRYLTVRDDGKILSDITESDRR